jgi:hypothetical protein
MAAGVASRNKVAVAEDSARRTHSKCLIRPMPVFDPLPTNPAEARTWEINIKIEDNPWHHHIPAPIQVDAARLSRMRSQSILSRVK